MGSSPPDARTGCNEQAKHDGRMKLGPARIVGPMQMMAKIFPDACPQEGPPQSLPGLAKLRLQVMEISPILGQVLALRMTAWSGRISLTPDVLRWGDAIDTRALHWCIFSDAELVATGRLSVHASFADFADHRRFAPLRADLRFPVALMSHEAIHPRVRGLRLGAALDAARMEQARQLRCPVMLAVADSARRASALLAMGFELVGGAAPGAGPRPGYALRLDLSNDPIRTEHRSKP